MIVEVIDTWKRVHTFQCDNWQDAYRIRNRLNKTHNAINRFFVKGNMSPHGILNAY